MKKLNNWGNDDLINLEQERAGNNEESDNEEIETKEFSVKELQEMFIAFDLLKRNIVIQILNVPFAFHEK